MTQGSMEWDNNADPVSSKVMQIKRNVRAFETVFADNYNNYNNCKNFLYVSSLTAKDRQVLTDMGRPSLEANLLPSEISRLLGEFSSQEFGAVITPSTELEKEWLDKKENKPELSEIKDVQNGMPNNIVNLTQSNQLPSQKDDTIAQILNDHANYLLLSENNKDFQYNIIKDLFTGGWSVGEIEEYYEHALSMIPRIRFIIPEDRTLCGFDPNAKQEDKGDGNFCFKKFVMTRKDFELLYPDVNISSVDFDYASSDESWAFRSNDTDVLVICDYYEKEKIPFEIVKLSTGQVVPLEVYRKMKKENKSVMRVGDARRTYIEKIKFYRVTESIIVEEKDTLHKKLPLFFFRGNGDYVKQDKTENVRERCLSYINHAMDAQRLKNFTLNSVANEIENIMQHKIMVAQEALPTQPEWRASFFNYQKAAVLFFKSRYEDNHEMAIPNPIMPVPRVAAPPELFQTFIEADKLIQNVLGTVGTAPDQNLNDLSGTAIMQAQMQSNPTAMPFVTGMAHGLESMVQAYVDMLPEYIDHYDSLPVIRSNYKKDTVKLKNDLKKHMDYLPGQLKVNIKVGASYGIQKRMSLSMVTNLMRVAPNLQQFFGSTPEGLNYILDNLDGKNIDALKKQIDGWVNQQQQMMQQQQKNNPEMMKVQMEQQKMQMEQQKMQFQNQFDMQKIQLEKEKLEMQHRIEMLKLEVAHNKIDADLHMSARKDHMEIEKEKIAHHDRSINTLLKAEDQHRLHEREDKKMEHEITVAKDEKNEQNAKST